MPLELGSKVVSEETIDDGGEEGGSKTGGKGLLLFILLPVLLLGGGAAAAWYLGYFGSPSPEEEMAEGEAGEGEGEEAEMDDGPGHFFKMPEMLVNLSAGGRQPRYLKITITLEIPSEKQAPEVEAVQARLEDTFQTYLRELRPEDLSGSAGLYRMKQELHARVNTILPVKVRDVLFSEVLIQ